MNNPFTTTQATVLPSREEATCNLPCFQRTSSAQLQLAFITASFRGISLHEMNAVALLRRVDTKFGMTLSQLQTVLPELRKDYRILTIHGQRFQPYRTLYFDTSDFDLFRLHVNDRADQYKVRIREYEITQQTFLEVKHKTQKCRTIKTRKPLNATLPILGQDEMDWLSSNLPAQYLNLEPNLLNEFTRIVLVDNHLTERITLDINIKFSFGANVYSANQVVVAEVKQSNRHQPSYFMEIMHRYHLRSMGFSKYCLGISSLNHNIKTNAQKSQLLWIKRANGEI